MQCSQCGKQILPGSRFCPNCGAAIAEPSSTWQSTSGSVPPPAPGATSRVRPELLRPRSGRMIGGVCAAFARTYGWNVTVVRIILVVAGLHAGLGLIAYIVAWIIIPEEPYLLATGSR